jgi:hypothetical protein
MEIAFVVEDRELVSLNYNPRITFFCRFPVFTTADVIGFLLDEQKPP